MNFKECITRNQLIETGDKDANKAKELVSLAKHKLTFWKEIREKSKKYPSLFLEGYYEIVKELSTAILLLDGWKSENHDCLFQYLIDKKSDLEIDFEFLTELRKTRNKIDYEGVKVSYELWQKNELRLDLTIKRLIEYVSNKIN
ncbi:hypothetical protein HY837_05675 [archaeon]|nr:hypothetical protein [archaeon]